jgi:Ser/Thr protein kinase RdoA (MazF antagonist)
MGRTFKTMSRLWQAPAFQSAPWTIPRPLSYDAPRHLLWQSALPGSSFWGLHDRIDVAAAWSDMARAAALLHTIEFAPPGRSLDALPDGRADVLTENYPELATWRARLMDRLLDRGASFEPIEARSLHGDFHPDQFLIDDHRMALTDFDTAAWGDPAYDPARFTSHVILKTLQRDLDPGTFSEPLGAFLDAYLREAPAGVSRARVCWHTAAQLLGRRVYKIVKQETASPGEKIETMLRAAEEYLTRSLDAR